MQTTANLGAGEIKEAIAQYVERETGGKVLENGITVHVGERSNITASAKYESSKS